MALATWLVKKVLNRGLDRRSWRAKMSNRSTDW
jgi:hypothetical protein